LSPVNCDVCGELRVFDIINYHECPNVVYYSRVEFSDPTLLETLEIIGPGTIR